MPCLADAISSVSISMIGKSENITMSSFSLSVPLRCLSLFPTWLKYIPLQYVRNRHTIDLVPGVVFYLITLHYCQQICNCSSHLFVHRCAKTITRHLIVKIRLSLQLSTFSFILRLSVVYLFCSCWCCSTWSWPLSLWPWYHIWWLNVLFVYLRTNTHHRVFPRVSTRFSCCLLIVFHPWINNIIDITNQLPLFTNWFHLPYMFACLSHSTPSLQLSAVVFCCGRFFWSVAVYESR